MIYPKFLIENGTIGVPAPSAGADSPERKSKMLNSKHCLEQEGYSLILSENLFNCNRCRSSNEINRAKEINMMFNNKDIDLILCAAGGEFLVEILPYINFELLKNNPKYVAGFSDPTGLLYPITTKYTWLNQSHYDRFLKVVMNDFIDMDKDNFYDNENKPEIILNFNPITELGTVKIIINRT